MWLALFLIRLVALSILCAKFEAIRDLPLGADESRVEFMFEAWLRPPAWLDKVD